MYERVLVPLDGSERAEAILPIVEQMAGPLDAEFVLLRVVEPISPGEAMASAGVVSPDIFALRKMAAFGQGPRSADRRRRFSPPPRPPALTSSPWRLMGGPAWVASWSGPWLKPSFEPHRCRSS